MTKRKLGEAILLNMVLKAVRGSHVHLLCTIEYGTQLNGGHQIMVRYICTNVHLLAYSTADNFGRCVYTSSCGIC